MSQPESTNPVCPVCGHALTAYCPACRGRAGGTVTSPAKARAARKNGRQAKWPRLPPTGRDGAATPRPRRPA